jgi:hypothetical protein
MPKAGKRKTGKKKLFEKKNGRFIPDDFSASDNTNVKSMMKSM